MEQHLHSSRGSSRTEAIIVRNIAALGLPCDGPGVGTNLAKLTATGATQNRCIRAWFRGTELCP